MSVDTAPVFVIGSGRSGTEMVRKLLSQVPGIEIHHEYLCTHIQKAACLYSMGRMDANELKEVVLRLHGRAIHYTEAVTWVDCSNKLSWLIGPLCELFPRAKFVNLLRDGRKVVSSFYHKLANEIYDDKSVRTLQAWLASGDAVPVPPPEKKYWWNIPQAGQPFAEQFERFDQFQRICYHWCEVNRVILDSLRGVHAGKQLTVKLEDLVADTATLERFLCFFGVAYDGRFFDMLQRPHNVVFPRDFLLSDAQLAAFSSIAGEMMYRLGYSSEREYQVSY